MKMTLQLSRCHWPVSFSHHLHRPSLSHLSPPPPSSLPTTAHQPIRAHLQTKPTQLQAVAELPNQEEGPIQLPPSSPFSFSSSPLFADPNNPSTLQVATSVLLTGAISVFLFRSLRRRAKRAKEMKFRSSGATKKKGIKEEALDSLKAMQSVSVEPGSPPSPVQALLGGISAGVIAIVLYKFTTTIEGALSRQSISDNFSVRQITITIRTIINGMCYLATFVFGINAIGLVLYSGQLTFNSFMESTSSDSTSSTQDEQQKTSNPPTGDASDNVEFNSDGGQKNTDESQ